jgi:hypothetical protein
MTMRFSREKLLDEQTFFFHPTFFDATPNLISVALTMEVVGRPASGLVNVRLSGELVRESFEVFGVGQTGPNKETIAAGLVLVNTQRGVFEGLFTVVLINDIWTAANPIVMVEGIQAELNSFSDTMRITTGAPDEAFIVPSIATVLNERAFSFEPTPVDGSSREGRK